MKDLYRRNKLAPRESDRVKINNAAGSQEDREAAFAILLSPARKAEYDRAHLTLSRIGYLRRHLGLAGNADWRRQHSDFLEPPPSDAAQRRPQRRTLDIQVRWRWDWLLSWPVVLLALIALLPLAYLALGQERVSGTEAVQSPPAAAELYQERGLANCDGGLRRPASGAVLETGRPGRHLLSVTNPSGRDALVKLKNPQGLTQLTFYLRGGEAARIAGIPTGRYQLQYALGRKFAPACGRFLEEMDLRLLPRFLSFGLERGVPGVRSQKLSGRTEDYLTISRETFQN